MGQYLAENVVYLVGVGEDTAASMFGGDSAHRTADVPVYFFITYIVETVGKFNELNWLFAQNLGDDRNGVTSEFG